MKIFMQADKGNLTDAEMTGSFDDLTAALAFLLMTLANDASEDPKLRKLARLEIMCRVAEAMAMSEREDRANKKPSDKKPGDKKPNDKKPEAGIKIAIAHDIDEVMDIIRKAVEGDND